MQFPDGPGDPAAPDANRRVLTALGLREVMALAIDIERRNGRRLRAFAEAFRGSDDGVAAKLDELAREEDGHEMALVQEYRLRFAGEVPHVSELNVAGVVEAFDLDDAEHRIFDTLAPTRIYELALRAETQAQAFYREASASCQDPPLAALFLGLSAKEEAHVGWLTERIRASGGTAT
ncbi:MAG: ferritin family protein [Planctomycetes bacterium]|nr:ferritin family protein [Planctomycetota bacterium]